MLDFYFSGKSSWQRDVPVIVINRYLEYFLAGLGAVFTTAMIVLKRKRIRLNGFQFEWFFAWPLLSATLTHCVADARRILYCVDGSFSAVHQPTRHVQTLSMGSS